MQNERIYTIWFGFNDLNVMYTGETQIRNVFDSLSAHDLCFFL